MIPPILPTHDDLAPFLAKLEQHEGSVVLIAIEWPRETQNFPRVGTAWFDADARKRLRRALKGEARRGSQSAGVHGSFPGPKAEGVASAPCS